MTEEALQQRAGELLRHASVVNHYENLLAEARGDRFNLFQVLRISRAETVTHSPMLAALLDAAGSHRKGDIFLKEFLKILKIKDFHSANARVDLEYHAGTKTERSGGRLDILIREGNSDRRIVIENKIDAGLQENQLERYSDYAAGHLVLYLTLQGGLPDGFDVSKHPNLRDISYHGHIRPWLERCRDLAADSPKLRESIAQYLELIDELTDRNPNPLMSETLAQKILENREAYLAFIALKRSQNEVERNILNTLREELERECCDCGLELRGDFEALGNSGGYLSFHNDALTTAGIAIGMEFAKSGYRDCDWGFFLLPGHSSFHAGEELRESFKSEYGLPITSSHWPAYRKWEEYRHWTEEVFVEIKFGSFSKIVMTEAKRLLRVFERTRIESAPA
jgi:hypothetical protein